MHEDYRTRHETPTVQDGIEIKCLSFWSSLSRLDTFAGNWLRFIIGYTIFFTATSMMFLIPNDTMPPNSYFYLTKKSLDKYDCKITCM